MAQGLPELMADSDALVEVFLNLSVADRLRVYFLSGDIGNDPDSWRLRKELWNNPRVVLGASDAGAHLDSLDVFSVRRQLEHAQHPAGQKAQGDDERQNDHSDKDVLHGRGCYLAPGTRQ